MVQAEEKLGLKSGRFALLITPSGNLMGFYPKTIWWKLEARQMRLPFRLSFFAVRLQGRISLETEERSGDGVDTALLRLLLSFKNERL